MEDELRSLESHLCHQRAGFRYFREVGAYLRFSVLTLIGHGEPTCYRIDCSPPTARQPKLKKKIKSVEVGKWWDSNLCRSHCVKMIKSTAHDLGKPGTFYFDGKGNRIKRPPLKKPAPKTGKAAP